MAFKPVCKYWDRITRPEQLMTALVSAMRVLTDPTDMRIQQSQQLQPHLQEKERMLAKRVP